MSSELVRSVENLNIVVEPNEDNPSASPNNQQSAQQWTPNNSLPLETYLPEDTTRKDEMLSKNICKHLQNHGICMLNDFLLKDQAEKKSVVGVILRKPSNDYSNLLEMLRYCCQVYKDVLNLYKQHNLFIDGEVVKQGSKTGSDRVRGDRITWVDQSYSQCPSLKLMCQKLDKLIDLSCKRLEYKVESRTKPMVACYPGGGSSYQRHVDNPTGDGRLLTCLYYLNKNWNPKVDGGSLCLYPGGEKKLVCEPFFNRLCIFFSDNRNPHEVLPCYRERFAVTCWYFEQEERRKALEKWEKGKSKKEKRKK